MRGVTVRRFANARTRDIAGVQQVLGLDLQQHATRRQDEMEWLKQQGPWSPGLIDYLERHHQHVRRPDLLHLPLRADGAWASRIAPSKSLLVPTAHDEPAIRLGIYEDVFASAAGIVWNTEAERAIRDVARSICARWSRTSSAAASTCPRARRSTATDGAGDRAADEPRAAAAAYRRPGQRVPPPPPHSRPVRCSTAAGSIRARAARSCSSTSRRYIREGGDATLMLMGVKLMPLPDDPHVRFAGMLPDEERLHALEAATVVVVPSPHESLSLLALEAFAVGTPVLANARAEVLVDHCRRSNAGLYYADRWEFVEALKLLMRDARSARGDGPQRQGLRQPATTAGASSCRKYERLFTRVKGTVREQRPVRR